MTERPTDGQTNQPTNYQTNQPTNYPTNLSTDQPTDVIGEATLSINCLTNITMQNHFELELYLLVSICTTIHLYSIILHYHKYDIIYLVKCEHHLLFL